MSQERSAEFLRGAVATLEEIGAYPLTLHTYRALLAEAEAREASVPTAAEVIAAAERALARMADHICDSSPYEVCIKNCPECLRQDALAAIAKWKEAQR